MIIKEPWALQSRAIVDSVVVSIAALGLCSHELRNNGDGGDDDEGEGKSEVGDSVTAQ